MDSISISSSSSSSSSYSDSVGVYASSSSSSITRSPSSSSSGSSLKGRVAVVEAVGTYSLPTSHQQSESDWDQYLAKGYAPLHLSSQIGGGGLLCRPVILTKNVEAGDKVQKREEDSDRQEVLNRTFAELKKALQLNKASLVNYDITTHSIEIYNVEGHLQGAYDLKDLGSLEELVGKEGIQAVSDRLVKLNNEIKELTKPETGGKFSYIFEVGNKGNLHGPLPFAPVSKGGKKILEDKEQGLSNRTLRRLGFIDNESQEGWLKKDRHVLTVAGAGVFNDLDRAKRFQQLILSKIKESISENSDVAERLAEIDLEFMKLSQGAHATVLNYMIMFLNSELTIGEETRLAKELLKDHPTEVANFVAGKFEKEFQAKHPNKPIPPEIHQIATELGALVFDVGHNVDPNKLSTIQKIRWIGERGGSIPQESRALELVVAAVVCGIKNDEYRGYQRESEVLDVMQGAIANANTTIFNTQDVPTFDEFHELQGAIKTLTSSSFD